MKNTFLIFTVLFIFIIKNSFSQINSKDFDSIGKSFYSRVIPFGTSLDIGIAVGKFSNSDSTNFAQLRTTFDATQIGVFSSEFAIGVGKVFNSSTPLMLEISTTLLAQFTKKIGVGAIFGSYDFIGEYERGNKQFFGLFLRYGPMRNESGGLIGRATRTIGKRRVRRR